MSFATKIEDLNEVLDSLPPKDQAFAKSLITQSNSYRGLSTKQWFWVEKLTKKAKGELPLAPVTVGDLTAAVALFDKAKTHLKFPKVILAVGSNRVRLSVAGPKARVPGSINVASVAAYDEGQWYGRILQDGTFNPTEAASSLPDLNQKLAEFAAEPAKVASEYGRLTGHCCFCSKPLTDERSTAVGYGATCAEHFGLPWGSRPVAFAEKAA